VNEREQLQELNLALEGALEQLARAHGNAANGAPAPELATIERLLGELTVLRNQVRERLMKELSKPSASTMTILK
jgi:hypothetical protein